jgi:hypothetical protein
MHKVPGWVAVSQGDSAIFGPVTTCGSGLPPACRRCSSTLDVGDVAGVGPLCLRCTNWALDAMLDLEARLLESHSASDHCPVSERALVGWEVVDGPIAQA